MTDADHRRHLLHEMLRIRRLEERCVELYASEEIRGFLHVCIGQEAVAAGALASLEPGDAIVATYREHGHALARGISARAIMAELLGRVDGCSRGRGGSMHIFDAATRFHGGQGIVGAGFPLAIGLGLAEHMRGDTGRISCCFFGEGAMAEGEFHESMNLAAVWNLPVLFICENNLYAMGTALDRSESETDLTLRAASYEIPAWSVDGMDVEAVEEGVRQQAAMVRNGGGPAFLEAKTFRFRAHSMYDPDLYRTREEIDRWRERDPIDLFAAKLREAGELDDAQLAEFERLVTEELDDAVEFARASPVEPVEELDRFLTAEAS